MIVFKIDLYLDLKAIILSCKDSVLYYIQLIVFQNFHIGNDEINYGWSCRI